jgi:hypothetical protein
MTRKCITMTDNMYEGLLRMIKSYATNAERDAGNSSLWESDREESARECERLLSWVAFIKEHTVTQEAIWSQGDIVNWVTKED